MAGVIVRPDADAAATIDATGGATGVVAESRRSGVTTGGLGAMAGDRGAIPADVDGGLGVRAAAGSGGGGLEDCVSVPRTPLTGASDWLRGAAASRSVVMRAP
jgi:hypothetical protein